MKIASATTVLLTLSSVATSLSVPTTNNALFRRREEAEAELIDSPLVERHNGWDISLAKRRGGGGGTGGGSGGGGGGGGRSSTSSSSGSTGSSGGSRGTSGSGSGGSRGSNTGSVARPSYGGGKYYGGGSPAAYRAGGRSPRGLLPVAVGLGAAAIIFPGIWLYGAYNYPYTGRYSYRNSTRRANTTGGDDDDDDDNRRLLRRQDDQNVSLPVTCLCQMYSACGCDDNDDPSYLDSVIGDGTNLNESLVHIGPVNGTQTIALNGTLPNDTESESDTSGGSSSSSTPTSSAGTTQRILETSGLWVVGSIVGATVWLL
ncbi:MAG: hypothetical protein Q9221_004512 [Calogaya cf. arnoldii]